MNTAAHIFKVCEKTHKTIRQFFEDCGIFSLPQAEVNKLAAVMSKSDVQWCVDTLLECGADESPELAERAAMWALAPCPKSEPLTKAPALPNKRIRRDAA